MALSAGASGYEGTPPTFVETTAAHAHPHSVEPPPWTVIDGVPVIAAVVYVAGRAVVRERFSFHVGLSPPFPG